MSDDSPDRTFTTAELMTVTMAHQLRDNEIVATGLYSPMPLAACLLAKRTHAPDLVHLNAGDAVDPDPEALPFSTADPALAEGAVAIMDLCFAFDMAQKGRIDMIFLGAAQIDKYGNTNLSVIGDFDRPKVRLPGGAASAHMCATANRITTWTTRHNRRTLVDKVDFITGQGFLDGPGGRERAGLTGGGPACVVTNLAVLDFHPVTKRMRLVSVHPGVTVEEVRDNTGFELVMPEQVPTTPPPTAEELRIMRTADPHRVKETEFH